MARRFHLKYVLWPGSRSSQMGYVKLAVCCLCIGGSDGVGGGDVVMPCGGAATIN